MLGVVVFDASGAGQPDDKVEDVHGVKVVYAHDSADAYIERETQRLKGDTQQVWAATNDNAVKVAASVHGATVVSSKWLVRELKGSREAAPEVIAEFNQRQARVQGRSTLWDAIDPATRQQLDASIEKGATAALSRRDQEARRAVEEMRSSGEMARGGIRARTRALAAARERARRRPERGGRVSGSDP